MTQFVVFRLVDGTEEDRFQSYEYSVSPGSRYIAFIKFYPLHGARPSQASNVLLVYDLQASVQANTVKGEGIGVPIFPEYNVLNKTHETGVISPNREHSITFGQGWKGDTVFTFTDGIVDSNFEVSVDLKDGVHKPVITRDRRGRRRLHEDQ